MTTSPRHVRNTLGSGRSSVPRLYRFWANRGLELTARCPANQSLFRQASLAPGLGVTGEYFRSRPVGGGESVDRESGIEGQDLSRRFAGRLVLPKPLKGSCQVRMA